MHLPSWIYRLLSALLLSALTACSTRQADVMTMGSPLHGWGQYSGGERAAVRQRRALLRRMAAFVVGEADNPKWDRATAVFWLADSGRAEFLPVLLTAASSPDDGVVLAAAYGLARIGSVRAEGALRELALEGHAGDRLRRDIAVMLAYVNNEASRRVLAEVLADPVYGPALGWLNLQRIQDVPASDPGGVWPCPSFGALEISNAGVHCGPQRLLEPDGY